MIKNLPYFLDIGNGLSVSTGLPTIPAWNVDNRPKKPKIGTFGFNSQTNSLEYWNGSHWLSAQMI